MKRAEVWLVNFDPSLGGEIRKTRPAVIISRDEANAALNRVQVVPLTSKINRFYPSEAYVLIKGRPHKAMTDQMGTVSKRRLKKRIGFVSKQDMDGIEKAVLFQLGLL